jgi:uncharacterized iron-regulated protein
MKLFILILILGISTSLFSQDKHAYKVFTAEGKKSDYEDIIKEISKSDFVFFGELHDNPIAQPKPKTWCLLQKCLRQIIKYL